MLLTRAYHSSTLKFCSDHTRKALQIVLYAEDKALQHRRLNAFSWLSIARVTVPSYGLVQFIHTLWINLWKTIVITCKIVFSLLSLWRHRGGYAIIWFGDDIREPDREE